MPLSQVFFWTVPIIALASYCLLMLVFSMVQKDRLIKTFMLVLAALILWTASSLFMKLQIYPGVLFWNRLMVTGMILVPFLLYCFVSVFMDQLKAGWLSLLAILTAGAVFVNLRGLVITDAGVNTTQMSNAAGGTYAAVEFYYTMGTWAYALYSLFFIMILVTVIKAVRFVRSGQSSYGQIGLILTGLMLLFGGALLNVFPNIGKYPFDILATLVNSGLIVIAIYKYRMLELRFMMTRGLLFSFFTLLITAGYMFAAFSLQGVFGMSMDGGSRYAILVSALLVAVAFQPLYKSTGKIVDRVFYKSEYAQRQALKNFSKSISNNLDLNQISRELFEAVKLAMPAKNVLLLLKQEEENYYALYKTSSRVFNPSFQISLENPIVKWLTVNKTSISRQELHSHPFFKSMWKREQQELSELDVEVITPIECRNELIGILMLTRKTNSNAYLPADLDLLTYLGTSSAMAIDNARLFAKTQSEAMTDNLTKLYNHRYFCKALPEEVKKVSYGGEISLLLIDLDFFKLYNDLYGHTEGDKALETIAHILRKNVGHKGTVFRYGGEEFVILLPNHDAHKAYVTAELIRRDIEQAFMNRSDVTNRFLTASIGLCTYPQGAGNSDDLLKRADLAMYTAKNKGKNQTVIYTPSGNGEEGNGEGNGEFTIKPANAATVYALTAAIDAKDHYTFGHSQRVAEYSYILAGGLGLDYTHQEIIREAALLHDIGKIGIPESILTKSERLNDKEYDTVKKHVEICITIIKHLSSQNHVIPAVLGHHERWDGQGYPRGLAGESIPIGARCLAVCDSFDAMTSERPYSPGISVEQALCEIEKNKGTQFDPEIAAVFIELVRNGAINVRAITDRYRSAGRPEPLEAAIPASPFTM